MTDSVYHLWVLSLNHSSTVHQALTELSRLIFRSRKQHMDACESQCKRDFEDHKKLREWLKLV